MQNTQRIIRSWGGPGHAHATVECLTCGATQTADEEEGGFAIEQWKCHCQQPACKRMVCAACPECDSCGLRVAPDCLTKYRGRGLCPVCMALAFSGLSPDQKAEMVHEYLEDLCALLIGRQRHEYLEDLCTSFLDSGTEILRALEEIAALTPESLGEYYDEGGEAACWHKAKEIADRALTGIKESL